MNFITGNYRLFSRMF